MQGLALPSGWQNQNGGGDALSAYHWCLNMCAEVCVFLEMVLGGSRKGIEQGEAVVPLFLLDVSSPTKFLYKKVSKELYELPCLLAPCSVALRPSLVLWCSTLLRCSALPCLWCSTLLQCSALHFRVAVQRPHPVASHPSFVCVCVCVAAVAAPYPVALQHRHY